MPQVQHLEGISREVGNIGGTLHCIVFIYLKINGFYFIEIQLNPGPHFTFSPFFLTCLAIEAHLLDDVKK